MGKIGRCNLDGSDVVTLFSGLDRPNDLAFAPEPATVIPEPVTMLSAFLAMGGLGVDLRRRRST